MRAAILDLVLCVLALLHHRMMSHTSQTSQRLHGYTSLLRNKILIDNMTYWSLSRGGMWLVWVKFVCHSLSSGGWLTVIGHRYEFKFGRGVSVLDYVSLASRIQSLASIVKTLYIRICLQRFYKLVLFGLASIAAWSYYPPFELMVIETWYLTTYWDLVYCKIDIKNEN